MKEELERNLNDQESFKMQMESLPKGYLSICLIDGKQYVYRKYRKGNKIISEYIGVPYDEKVQQAEKDREQYLDLKRTIRILKIEEKKLRGAIKEYERI